MQDKTKKRFKRIGAALAVVGVIVGVGVWNATQSNANEAATLAAQPDCKNLMYPLCARSVAATQVVDNSIPAYKKLVAGSVSEDRLSKAVQDKLNKVATPGKDGKDGKDGVSGVHADAPYGANLPGQDSSSTTIPAGKTAVVWTACAPGEAALGGGFRLGDLANESFGTGTTVAYPKLQVVASEAAFYKDGKLVNGSEVAPVNENQSFRPNAWAVTVHNSDDADSVARAWVVCAKIAG